MLVILFLFRRLPRPLRLLSLAVFIAIVIESIAHTYHLYRYSQERQQHVHSHRNSR